MNTAQRILLQPAGRGALGSVGEIVRCPLVRGTVKYWWLALPIAYLGYHSWKKHSGKPTVDALADTVNDIAPVVATVATLVLLNHAMADRENGVNHFAKKPAAVPQAKDAAFTVRQSTTTPPPASTPALPAPAEEAVVADGQAEE